MAQPTAFESNPESFISRRQFLAGAGLALSSLALEACSSNNNQEGRIIPHIYMETEEITQPTDLSQNPAWSYMAGAQPADGGLELTPTGLSIINKRAGNVYAPDPPLEV